MEISSKEMKKLVYELMTGEVDLDKIPMTERDLVKDEYATGMPCDIWYQQVYEAKLRLGKKLQEDENNDVELIISNMEKISEYLSLKMFDYGTIFAHE